MKFIFYAYSGAKIIIYRWS